ncbi:uncharacterized mitochondrial protein-like protein [Tanacetum coccineum]
MELEPETRIPGLECNRALLENVPFVNNMVIEEPEYGIFFTGEFGDQAFQRWSDIDKVGMEALVSYLVVASLVKSPENARFSMKLRKLIAEHPNQEKLKYKSRDQLVKINKVIRGCKLEIEGHIFDIDLIPFRHGSFDVIVWMDGLSRHKVEIVCHEKVVRIPLPNGKMLRVLRERPKEKARHFLNAKAEEQKLKDVIVVNNFSEVFLDDLSGLPPS